MIQTRHRLLAALAAVVALAYASQASAQTTLLVLSYSQAKTFGNVHIAGGAIDMTNGAMIVTTSSFGFVPSGGQVNEYGSPGVPEYGDAAIHDAIAEGANYAGGFWNGTNGIISSSAATDPKFDTAVGWLDNSIGAYSTWGGQSVGPGQSIIATTWYGDADLNGYVNGADTSLWSTTVSSGPFGGQTGAITGGKPQWVDGDWDQDGNATGADTSLWSTVLGNGDGGDRGFNPGGPIVPSAAAATVTAVPEPSTVLLLAVAFVCGIYCRAFRRKVS